MGAVLLTLTSCLVWVWSLVSSGKEESRGPSGSSCEHEGQPLPLASASTKSTPVSVYVCAGPRELKDHRQIGTEGAAGAGLDKDSFPRSQPALAGWTQP